MFTAVTLKQISTKQNKIVDISETFWFQANFCGGFHRLSAFVEIYQVVIKPPKICLCKNFNFSHVLDPFVIAKGQSFRYIFYPTPLSRILYLIYPNLYICLEIHIVSSLIIQVLTGWCVKICTLQSLTRLHTSRN